MAADTSRLVGRDVIVQALTNRAELNGMCGSVASFDADKARYVVRVPGVPNALLLKPENVVRAPDAAEAIAASCAADHAEEVRERVEAIRTGVKQTSDDLPQPPGVLDLEHTGLVALPAAVGTLGLTRELWLGNNKLTALPNAVGCLLMLRVLDIDGNALTELPESISRLCALEALYANHNLFARLPAALGRLRSLRELRLSDNRLSAADSLPAELGTGLQGCLRTLWLARNGLVAVPEPVCALMALEDLDLSGNAALSALPPSLAALRRLRTLELAGNAALIWPPPEVASQGAEVIQAWLRAVPPTGRISEEDAEAVGAGVVYAREPAGSVHTPIARQEAVEGGGEFIFPGGA